MGSWTWSLFHRPLESLEPGYMLSLDEYTAGWTVDELATLFFEESDVDITAYHTVEYLRLSRTAAPRSRLEAR